MRNKKKIKLIRNERKKTSAMENFLSWQPGHQKAKTNNQFKNRTSEYESTGLVWFYEVISKKQQKQY